MEASHLRRPPRRRRGPTAVAAEVLGVPVGVAVPVQRHPPHRVLILCGVELAAFALLALTGSLVALAVVAVAGGVLLAVGATNRRRVLAVSRGELVVMAATLRGRPLGPIGPAPSGLELPAPEGIGVPVLLDDGCWWVDRSAYARLRLARELRSRRATGGG